MQLQEPQKKHIRPATNSPPPPTNEFKQQAGGKKDRSKVWETFVRVCSKEFVQSEEGMGWKKNTRNECKLHFGIASPLLQS